MRLESEKWFNPSNGEEPLWYSQPSFIFRLPTLLFGLVVALIGLVASIYIFVFQDWPVELVYISLLLIPLGLGWTGVQMIIYKNTWYVITNRRVITKRGVIGRESSSKPHREIVRVDVQVSTLEAVLSRVTSEDIGDIVIRTADDSGEKFILSEVPDVGLAESYIERLSGTGPDTPAQYDAEERDRLKHEKYSNRNHDRSEDQRRPQKEMNQQNQPPQQERPNDNKPTSSPPPDPTTEIDDIDDEDMSDFEPSDHA